MTPQSFAAGQASQKTCQNCKNSFTIEPQDFDFYAKIKVPPPTFCPFCRMQRRLAYRNERTMYRRTCGLSGKPVISCFAPDSGITVYERDLWWSDDWNPDEFYLDYDFSKPFFAQFRALLEKMPMPAMFYSQCTGTTYCNYVGQFKDAYLVSASWQGENITYASRCNSSRDCMDMYATVDSELSYGDVSCTKVHGVFFSQNSENCSDSWLLYDCKNCSNCVGCVGLRNKQYYIWNEPYTKEEYQRKLADLKLGSRSGLANAEKRLEELKVGSIRKFANILNCENVTGDNLSNAANCFDCFEIAKEARDSRFVTNGGWKMADCYDGYGLGESGELIYESADTGIQGARMLFNLTVWGVNNSTYSINCHGGHDLFGCVGMRNKEYRILNKPYSKEEYESLVPKIVAHMNDMPYVDKKGRIHKYGEFFPVETSPVAYNETIAQDYFPLTKAQVAEQGYAWRDPVQPEHAATMKADDLPDDVADAKEDLLKEIIQCSNCPKLYRIIPKELAFLRNYKVPLPRMCPECRHQARFRKVNFPKLYKRQCACLSKPELKSKNTIAHFHSESPCPNVFSTTYAPERPEIVYCEQCYNAEVV